MLWQALSSVRDLGRLQDIASILIRYGFGELVRRMGLAAALERAGKALHWNHVENVAHLSAPARVRQALEEMGPTFVKLGQVLATRVDLFDPEWITEFSKLQDDAPAVPYAEIREQLIEDLGAPPEEVFAFFDTEPLAAASVAQVHRARLDDGTEVIVKVRRPGIRPVIEADLRWMMRLAQLAQSESPELRTFSPEEVVRQFAHSLRNELDFAVECRNAKRIADHFVGYVDADAFHAAQVGVKPTSNPRGDAGGDAADVSMPPLNGPTAGQDAAAMGQDIIVVPKIYWQYSGERVCVQEFINGISGRRLAELDRAGLDRKLLARRGTRAVIKMIIEDGFFHADPHPGNVFYLPGNRIAFIDFGMVGRLSEQRREQLMRLLLGLVRQESQRVADVLLDWTGDGAKDQDSLVQDIEEFVEQYRGVALKQIRFGQVLADLVSILRHHQVVVPPDLSLLIKAFISLEGMGAELDPDFNVAAEALPGLEKALRERYAPMAVMKRGWKSATDVLALIADLPQDFSRLLRAARRGRLEIHLDITNLKRVGNQLDGAVNRLVVGVVIAALIIGSSIVMTVSGGPSLFGLPVFGLLGFLGAGIGSLMLLLSIAKATRKDRE